MKHIKSMKQEIWHGDCLELMKKIPDESIDLVLTDPPYDINLDTWDVIHDNKNSALGGASPAQEKTSFKRRGKPINGWSKADRNQPKQYQKWCEEWLKEINRITKEASPILIFNSRRLLHRLAVASEEAGLIVKDILIWEKIKANGKAQDVNKIPAIQKSGKIFNNYRVGNLKPMFEPILYCIKPYRYTLSDAILKNGNGGFYSFGSDIRSNIFTHQNDSDGFHPTQKPVDLLENLIKTFTREGQSIFDLFAGSGSTLVAAKNLNRQFIGIEKEKEYYDICVERLK